MGGSRKTNWTSDLVDVTSCNPDIMGACLHAICSSRRTEVCCFRGPVEQVRPGLAMNMALLLNNSIHFTIGPSISNRQYLSKRECILWAVFNPHNTNHLEAYGLFSATIVLHNHVHSPGHGGS